MSAPPVHTVVPGEQTPTALPQLAPPPGLPSSEGPSQSLSSPSQTSAVGPRAPTQVKLPLTQVLTP